MFPVPMTLLFYHVNQNQVPLMKVCSRTRLYALCVLRFKVNIMAMACSATASGE
jgi:hypothetical protein